MLVALVMGAPIYWMLVTAFKTSKDINQLVPQFWPKHPSLSAFREVLGDPIFRDDLRNSLVITLSAVLISLVVGFFGALAIARFRFAGRKVFIFAVLVVQMIPLLALTIPLSLLLDRAHLKNSLIGVVIAYLMFSMPYTVWTLRTFIAGIPRELDEAAMVDGCSRWQTFYKIILPLVGPGLVATGVYAWILAWNEFVLANTLLLDNNKQTGDGLPPGLPVQPDPRRRLRRPDGGGHTDGAPGRDPLRPLPEPHLRGSHGRGGEGLMTVLSGARVVTPDGVLHPAWVEVVDGRIARVETSRPPTGSLDLADGWLLPGFVDLHVHGGGGHDFTGSAEDMAAGVAFHRRHGTTSTLVSLMAGPVDAMSEQLGWVAALTAAGEILGAHLEGPFLASARCGAQNPGHLAVPDPLVLAKLLSAGQDAVRTVTIAPELPGAIELIRDVVAAGAIAAIGHTDATYEQAAAGFAAGATLATHLFNAMGSMSQRAPGPAIAALDAGVYVELINDGVHVHEALTRLAVASTPADGLGRVALITDAISATGVGDGHYSLGDQDVVVRDGEARLASTQRLAGSTLTMDLAVRRAVQVVGLTVEQASAAASATPARVLGIDDHRGAIAPGLDADLVVLDDDLRVQRVMVRGHWL